MAFDIALTGLSASTTDLDVIANNVANSSTAGFKQSRAEFGDIYAVGNLGIASNATGQGVEVTTVTQQFQQGDLRFTENNLDLSISGRGFFRLSDGGSLIYTRSGAFGIDSAGFIENAKGERLTGLQADAAGNITGVLGELQIQTSNQQPLASTTIDIGANIDASEPIPPAFAVGPGGPDPATFNHSSAITVFDSLGTPHVTTNYFRKDAANQWEVFMFVDGVQRDGPDIVTFNTDGSLNLINGAPVTTLTAPAFNPGGGAANLSLTMDFADLSQFGSAFAVTSLSQDGYPTGRLNALDIDVSGVIFARFTNGQSLALGQVVLSNFSNVQGLQPLGNTGWAETFSSGAPLTGSPGSGDLGQVQSGALEESNVDLTAELVALITAQRNFQANAQVISAADDVTQTIINIR